MSASVEYRGYTIRYSDNEDEWTCYDVGASNVRLSRVKAKIDDMHRKMRKAAALPCLTYTSYRGVTATEASIVEYIAPLRKKAHSFERVHTGEIEDHEVAFMSARNGRQAGRQKGPLSQLALDTPENRETISKAQALHAKAESILAEMRDILKTLQPPTIDDIRDLVQASEHRFTEGDDT